MKNSSKTNFFNVKKFFSLSYQIEAVLTSTRAIKKLCHQIPVSKFLLRKTFAKYRLETQIFFNKIFIY